MKIENQVLSIEQMKHLQELGVDTSDASMCWLKYTGTDGVVRYLINANDISCHVMPFMEAFPTYSIGDLIEKLPKHIDSWNDNRIVIEGDEDVDYWYAVYKNRYEDAETEYSDSENLLTALYNLLCWVAETHKELLNKNNQE